MKNTGKKFLMLLFTCCLLLTGLSVTAAASQKAQSMGKIELTAGTKKTLTISNTGGKKVSWKSSRAKVVSVTKKGVVTAKKAGTAKITATVGASSKYTWNVTVKAKSVPVKKITLNKTTASMNVGKSITLKARISPKKASNKDVIWSSSNNNVASVSKKGVVTAKNTGTVTITATASDGSQKSASCQITIKKPLSSRLKLENVPNSLVVGKTRQLAVTVTPENASQEVTWKSSDTRIATVSGTGLVTAVAPGSVTITVTSTDNSNLSISCNITIKAKTVEVEKLTLSGYRKTLTAGKTMQLKVDAIPANSCSEFTWESSNVKVATVSQTGLVTGIAPGRTTITVKAANGSSASVSADIEVTAAASSKKVTGITASCSLSSASSPNEITEDTLTVYEVYEDGSKAELGMYSVKTSEDSSQNAYVVTITTSDKKFSTKITVKKREDSSGDSSKPAYVRTDISCKLAEVKYGYRFTASDFTVVDVYSDGSTAPASFEVAVKPYADGYYTVVITAKNAEKTLKIKVTNPPAEQTEPENSEQEVSHCRFILDPDYVYVGEGLKSGQFKMFVTYSGSDEEIEVTDFTCDFTPKSTPGTYPFHIAWKGLKNEFTIKVKEKPSEESKPSEDKEPTLVELSAQYTKDTFIFSDETPSKDDITVTGKYSDGSTRKITDFTFDFTPTSVHKGKAVVKVHYDGKTLSFGIPSYVRTETKSIEYGLRIPSIGVNEALDKSDIMVNSIDYDGNKTPVTDFEIDFTPKSEPGTYSFHIYYKDFTVTQEITVE